MASMRFPGAERLAKNTTRYAPLRAGTMRRAMHWVTRLRLGASWNASMRGVGLMRNMTLAALTLATAIALPVVAQAQGYTTGVVRGPAVIVDESAGIAVEQRP